MKEFLSFSDITRGPFLKLQAVPVNGYRWVETVPILTDDGVEELTGPWLVEVDPSNEPQWVTREPLLYNSDLHRRFAKLTTQQSILRFANRYGRLGISEETVGRRGKPLARLQDPWERPERLSRWLNEVRLLGGLIQFWDLVKDEREQDLQPFIRWETSSVRRVRLSFCYIGPPQCQLLPYSKARASLGSEYAGNHIVLAHEKTPSKAQVLGLWQEGEVLGPIRYYVSTEVNRRLKGHVNSLLLTSAGTQLYFEPDTTLAALYTLFALEISGQDKPRILCAREGCGQYFVPERKGQLYCEDNCRKLAHYHYKKSRPATSAKRPEE